jgi:hypothetical protein
LFRCARPEHQHLNIARNGPPLSGVALRRVTEESRMRRVSYTNDRWFMRTARTLPVVAMAALTGGAIGGFSVYAIILALTEAPNIDAATKTAATQSADSRPQNTVSPIRTIGTPPPNVTEPPTLLTQPPQQAQASSAPQTPVPSAPISQPVAPQAPWPDALSRAHPAPQETAKPAPVTTPPAGSEAVAAAAAKPVPPKPLTQKRRVASRKPQPAPNQTTPYPSNSATAARSQPVYDYYDNNNYNRYGDNYGGNRYGDATPAPRGRVVVRRQYYQSYAQQPPPQPAPPGFFGGGFFGGGDRYGWR